MNKKSRSIFLIIINIIPCIFLKYNSYRNNSFFPLIFIILLRKYVHEYKRRNIFRTTINIFPSFQSIIPIEIIIFTTERVGFFNEMIVSPCSVVSSIEDDHFWRERHFYAENNHFCHRSNSCPTLFWSGSSHCLLR